MIGDGYRADHEALAARAAPFAELADRARSITGELAGTLGEPWGTDDVGRSFADGHVAAARAALDGLGALAGELGGVGDRFLASADVYRAADEDAAADQRATGEALA